VKIYLRFVGGNDFGLTYFWDSSILLRPDTLAKASEITWRSSFDADATMRLSK
jgi:hypothetical protein